MPFLEKNAKLNLTNTGALEKRTSWISSVEMREGTTENSIFILVPILLKCRFLFLLQKSVFN
jgi:hypothetical protein